MIKYSETHPPSEFEVNIGRPDIIDNSSRKYWAEFNEYVETCEYPIYVNGIFSGIKENLKDPAWTYMGGGYKYLFWFDTEEDQITFLKKFNISLELYLLYPNMNFSVEMENKEEETNDSIAKLLSLFEQSSSKDPFNTRPFFIKAGEIYEFYKSYKTKTTIITEKYNSLSQDEKILLWNEVMKSDLFLEECWKHESGIGTCVNRPNLTINKYIELFEQLLNL